MTKSIAVAIGAYKITSLSNSHTHLSLSLSSPCSISQFTQTTSLPMLSSTDWEETHYNNTPPTTITLNKVSSLPFKSPQQQQTSSSRAPKTMEEVWNDINLTSLHDHTSREPFSVNSNHHNNTHFILQDFLATRPLSNDAPTNRVSTTGDNNLLYASSVPPPATVLSLNSGPGFDFLDNIGSSTRLQSSPISTLPTFNSPFEALASSSSLASFGKKRVQESDNSGGDRRHKRMIKNRESAARSRARKQAYTNELEHEVTLLMEENKKLREQQEQLRVAAAAQITRKRTLHRTSTAPF